jgi:hypothetical protein
LVYEYDLDTRANRYFGLVTPKLREELDAYASSLREEKARKNDPAQGLLFESVPVPKPVVSGGVLRELVLSRFPMDSSSQGHHLLEEIFWGRGDPRMYPIIMQDIDLVKDIERR